MRLFQRFVPDTSALLTLRDEDQASGQLAHRKCLALPIEWLSNTLATMPMPAPSFGGELTLNPTADRQ